MTGKNMFGLNHFGLILILFTLIRSNSSERFDNDAKTILLDQDAKNTAHRNPSLIDRLKHGNKLNFDRNLRDVFSVMDSNPSITMEKSYIPEEKQRKKRLVFLLPLVPVLGGITITAETAAAAAAIGASAAAIGIASQQTSIKWSHSEPATVMESSKPRQGQLPPGQNYHPAPKTKELTGFPGLTEQTPKTPKQNGGGLRKRWKDPKTKKTYEWDYQHGELEGYGKNGDHIGSFDPNTGEQTKDPVPGRKLRN